MHRDLIVFDLDGTLIDSRADLTQAANAVRGEYGLSPLPVETVSSYVGNGVHKLVERSLGGAAPDLDAAVESFQRHYGHCLHDHTVLYTGVEDGLRALAGNGFLLAVSSNKRGDWCRRIVAHFGLAPLFCCVIGGGDAALLKPDPAQLRLIQGRCGRPPDRTWMIGDHRTDLEAARRAGVASIFVRWGIGRAEPETPDYSVDSFPALVALLQAHSGRPPI